MEVSKNRELKININKALVYFLIVVLITTGFLYQVSSILAPFIIAIVFAYFLAPLVSKLERHKISRANGSILIILLLIAFFIIISFTIIPILYLQFVLLTEKVFENKDYLQNLMPHVGEKLSEYIPHFNEKFKLFLNEFSAKVVEFSTALIAGIVNSGFLAINIISLVFIMPIVLFYMLRDWNKIRGNFKSFIPPHMKAKTNDLFNELDLTLSGYIRGQTYVCLSMATYYIIAFNFVSLESATALGLISGLLTFIPYIGALFSCVLSLIVAIVQFGTLSKLGIIIIIFIFGQFIENNFVVPRLVGKNIKVHPVWIMFGLLAGGALFGFVGVLVALPLTAVLSVVIKFLLKEYKKSSLYIRG